jgi:hypothetical protein
MEMETSMRLVVAVGVCILAAFFLFIWPFKSQQTDAVTIPEIAHINVDVHFRVADRELSLLSDKVSHTRACVSFADLLTRKNIVRAQSAQKYPEAPGIVMEVAVESPKRFINNVVYRSGNLLREDAANAARLIAAIQADACSVIGDTQSQAHWMEIISLIQSIQK